MLRRLPVLRHRDDLRIPAPCDEDFDAMTPSGRGRACASCCEVVHDMSAMTEREAARFLAARRGQRTCVHFELRPDGSILYRREPARPLAPMMLVALAACTPHGPPRELTVDAAADAEPSVLPTATAAGYVPPPPAPPRSEPALVEPCDPRKAKPKDKRPVKKNREDIEVVDGMIEW